MEVWTDSLELRLQQSDRFSGSCVMEHNPRSNTHMHTRACAMHTHSDTFQRGDGHSKCLCSWNQKKINNYFSPSADSPEV